ncbi:hypothetical protein [Salana multivorans]
MSARVTICSPASWPGEDRETANHAALDVLLDPPTGVAGVPGLLTLPGRGQAAWPVARSLAIAESMPASLEPHGWRLASRSGTEQRRARRLVEGDVEAFALALAGEPGPVQVPVLGPFSLAAATWLPVGERVIVDDVARGDLVASLSLGVTRLLEALQAARDLPTLLPSPGNLAGPLEATRALPAVSAPRVQVLLNEPWLAQILAGTLPSFSGRSSLPALPAEAVTQGLRELVAAWPQHDVVVQVQTDERALQVAGSAGVAGLRLEAAALGMSAWDRLAPLVEAGVRVQWASVPLVRNARGRTDPGAVAASVLRPLRSIGLRPTSLELALGPGLSEVSPLAAQASLVGLARSAVALGEATAE